MSILNSKFQAWDIICDSLTESKLVLMKDITFSNVLLEASSVVYVIDFNEKRVDNSARMDSDCTVTSVAGTGMLFVCARSLVVKRG
jgi:hypothetical protein